MCVVEPEKFEDATKEEAYMEKSNERRDQNDRGNDTWELVDRLKDKDVTGVKWVYKIKHNSYGTIKKNKARLIKK